MCAKAFPTGPDPIATEGARKRAGGGGLSQHLYAQSAGCLAWGTGDGEGEDFVLLVG